MRALFKGLPFKSWQLLCGKSFSLPFTPKHILLFFIGFSFAVTALDVTMCHSQNNFIPKYEWIPIIYAMVAAVATFGYLFKPTNTALLNVYRVTMVLGVLVGIVGTFLHLFGNISVKEQQVVNWLIYSIPVFAPLAFTWMSLFGLALINPTPQRLVRLVGLAFLITALTAGFDHAQTNFANLYAMIPLAAGLLAFSICWLSSIHLVDRQGEQPAINTGIANLYYAVMLMMIVVGLVGFYLHLMANLEATVVLIPVKRFLYHAPILGPLLFAQLGTLGILSSLTVKDTSSQCYQQQCDCTAEGTC